GARLLGPGAQLPHVPHGLQRPSRRTRPEDCSAQRHYTFRESLPLAFTVVILASDGIIVVQRWPCVSRNENAAAGTRHAACQRAIAPREGNAGSQDGWILFQEFRGPVHC